MLVTQYTKNSQEFNVVKVHIAQLQILQRFPAADPGFPQGGGRQLPGGGAPTYDFAKFSRKLHEIERIWVPGGGARPLRPLRPLRPPPLNPPLIPIPIPMKSTKVRLGLILRVMIPTQSNNGN